MALLKLFSSLARTQLLMLVFEGLGCSGILCWCWGKKKNNVSVSGHAERQITTTTPTQLCSFKIVFSYCSIDTWLFTLMVMMPVQIIFKC